MHGTTHDQEKAVQELARSLYRQAAEHKPSIFESQDWLGKMIEWSLNDESLRDGGEIGRAIGQRRGRSDCAG